MKSICALIGAAREQEKCAEFAIKGVIFSAKEVNGRSSIYINGKKVSRKEAESTLKELLKTA